ncbi:MAG TPA: response regulator [Polyangiales bacterium]|nr:response regulator [Polyangiales bacterium]
MSKQPEEEDESGTLGTEVPAQVLVIDDQQIGRNSVIRLLESAGLTAVGAPSAIGATRLAIRRGIQVAIIDLNMPAMRGSSLIQVIRKSPRLAHVGIVLLSGASDEELVTAAGEAGADAAVSKLTMKDTLLPVVQKLLARAARVPQQSGRFSLVEHGAIGHRSKRGGTA